MRAAEVLVIGNWTLLVGLAALYPSQSMGEEEKGGSIVVAFVVCFFTFRLWQKGTK